MNWLMSRINFHKISSLALLLILVVVMAFPARAQQFSFTGKRAQDVLRFSLVKNLVVIPVYLNNKGPFHFILDTGVGPMIITDPALIDSLDLQVSRSIKVSGLGKGDEIDAFVSNDISAGVGKATMANIPTAILKKDIFGLSNYLGTKIYGLLGYYFFKSFMVELRYSRKKMRFSYPSATGKIKGERIPIAISSYKPYINVEIESPERQPMRLKMLVDNGASHAISLERWNEAPFPVPPIAIPANLGVGMSGPIDGSIGRIGVLKIGGIILKNVLAAYPVYDDVAAKVILKDRNGNLGADVWSRFNLTFDYEDQSMYLKKNAQFKRPFEHDMSGIELYLQEDKTRHYFISRVEPGSPADKAGIQVDDELAFINFQPASGFKLDDINSLFKAGDGKTIIISVFRNHELMVKVFKLKQRI
jgi:hypothetical protein